MIAHPLDAKIERLSDPLPPGTPIDQVIGRNLRVIALQIFRQLDLARFDTWGAWRD